MPNIVVTANKDIMPIQICLSNDLNDILRAKIIHAAQRSRIKYNSLFQALEETIEGGFSSIKAYAKDDNIVITDTNLSFKIKMFDYLIYETNQLDEHYFHHLNWYFQGHETALNKSVIEDIKPYVEEFKANIKNLENRTERIRKELSKVKMTNYSDFSAFLEYWNTFNFGCDKRLLYTSLYRMGIMEGKKQCAHNTDQVSPFEPPHTPNITMINCTREPTE